MILHSNFPSTSPFLHQLPLELSQSFVRNADGSYSSFRCPEPPPEPELPEGYRPDRPQAIRPMELRTFLKVGEWPPPPLSHVQKYRQEVVQLHLYTAAVFSASGPADQKEAGPFVIEWIPDALPRCRLGELRIGFEFGHQQSGQPEDGEKASAAEKGGRGRPDSAHTKHANAVEIIQLVIQWR